MEAAEQLKIAFDFAMRWEGDYSKELGELKTGKGGNRDGE